MTAFYVGCLVFAGLFLLWASTFGVRGLLKDFAAPLKQPDGSPDRCSDVAGDPPTAASVAASPSKSAVRPRIRVALSDPRTLSATLSSGWRLR